MVLIKNIIFYFSGTGNSLQLAKDIAKEIGDCEVLNLAQYDTSSRVTAERVGIVFPVYFWGIPLAVADFIGKLPTQAINYGNKTQRRKRYVNLNV